MEKNQSWDWLWRLHGEGTAAAGVCLFLATIVWIGFGQTLGHDFINYDDDVYVLENPVVTAGPTRWGILWAFRFGGIGHWHPVTWISHMVDCRVFGLWAGGHHLTNVVLHATAAILLFLGLKLMTGALWRSALVSVLFAIHPQRVESVAWIAERKDVLSGVFFMATLLAYGRYVAKPPSGFRYLLIMILFALGLMSKGMLVTLPFVLLLLDYWPLGRIKPDMIASIWQPKNRAVVWHLVVEKIPLFVLAAASCVMTNLSPEKIPPSLQVAFLSRVENAIVSHVIYVKQTLYPARLGLPYFNPPDGFPAWQVIAALVLLLGISVAALLFWKSRPYLVVGWLWFLGMMVPVIGLVQVSYYARADRYTYLPQIGLWIAATWGVGKLCRRWRWSRGIPTVAALLLITALTVRTQAQTSYWRSSETLWNHVLSQQPDNYVAHNNLGRIYGGKGQFETAVTHFEKALKIQPAYADALNNLGTALLRLGHGRDAIVNYQKAVDLTPNQPQFQNNLAIALAQNGQLVEAIPHFRRAVAINPTFAGAYANLGHALLLTGQFKEARAEFQKSVELEPNSAQTHRQVADLLLAEGQTAEAIVHYRRVLQIKPDDTEARLKLADALLKIKP